MESTAEYELLEADENEESKNKWEKLIKIIDDFFNVEVVTVYASRWEDDDGDDY